VLFFWFPKYAFKLNVSCGNPLYRLYVSAVAIYGVIIAIILQTKVEYAAPKPDGSYTQATMTSGYAILASGLTVGLAKLNECSLKAPGFQLLNL
jgi:hypothetical protein